MVVVVRKTPLLVATLGLLVVGSALWLIAHSLPGVRGDRRLDKARAAAQAGHPNDALGHYEAALGEATATGDRRREIRALLGSAGVFFESLGDLDQAETRLAEALALAREVGDPALEADALSRHGVFYWSYRQQRHRPLDEHYLPALALYRRLGDRAGEAATEGRIGLVYLARGEYEAAARHLEACRELYEALDDPIGSSDAHRYLGALHSQLERYDQARLHYAKSRELCEASGYRRGCQRLEALRAHLRLRLGDFEGVVEILDQLVAADDLPASTARYHRLDRGNALLHLGRPREARRDYEATLAQEETLPGRDPTFRARALAMLAHAHMQTGELDAAEEALRRAEAIPVAEKGWGETVLHTLARADLADLRGQRREALRHLLTAAEIEGQTFAVARSHFFQTQYRQIFDRLFSLLFDDVVSQEEAEALTFRFLEQMRYRSFRSLVVRLGAPTTGERRPSPEEKGDLETIDALGRRYAAAPTPELWQTLRRAYAVYEDRLLRSELGATTYRLLTDERPVVATELRRALAPDEALVEYVVAGDRVFALVVRPQGLTSAVMPTTTEELDTKVELFRHLLFEDRDPVGGDGRWRPLATELSRLLITPLDEAGALAGVRRLVLVPMAFLHDLPFAALVGSDGAFLVERFSLLRSPSATLWARPPSTSPDDGAERSAIAAFGLRQAEGSTLEPLDHAEAEARAVAALFGETARTGMAATEAELVRRATTARRLHIATHGLIEPGLPLHSRLRLEAGEDEDGELTVREILDLRLDAELVTLSACGTGSSATSRGRRGLEVDRLGFVEAFLHVGADQVLATLLPVSDATTAAFMARFYTLHQQLSASEALTTTRREILASGTLPGLAKGLPPELRHPGDLRHPRHWAPFVLVGTGGR